MTLVSYEYYAIEYNGTLLNEADFQFYARKASSEVNHATFGRLADMDDNEIPESVKDAVCEVAEQFYQLATVAEGGIIASESNDGHSVSYRSNGSVSSQSSKMRAIIRRHLGSTGLLYRGVML